MAKSRVDRNSQLSQRQRAATPLHGDELAELFAVVEVLLLRRGCDGTLRICERWLTGGGHEVPRVVRWLKENGGYCDCEVVFNVVPRAARRGQRVN